MAGDRAMHRCRWLFARLLRLYPRAFRDRFAASMEQTFGDLCRERRAAGEPLFPVALSAFGDTFAGILKERSVQLMLPGRSLLRLAAITLAILAIPFVSMQFSNEVNWDLFDFVGAGALLFGTGFAFETVARRSASAAYRAATGLACAAALLLIWMNLAVGLIGSEDNPANLLYLGVLLVGGIGVAIARLRPHGMSRALFATAVAQAVVPLLALVIWNPDLAGEGGRTGLTSVFFFNALFVLLFLASAMLFRRAGHVEPRAY